MKKHFVIITWGSSGDILPFIEIGKCLLGKGNSVSFMTNPYFETTVKDSGLTFVPFGTIDEHFGVLKDPGIWHPRTGFRIFWTKLIKPNLHRIRHYVQSLDVNQQVVILSHPSFVGLADLARVDRDNLKIVELYHYPTIIRTYFSRVALGGSVTLPRRTPRFLKKILYFLVDKSFDTGVVPGLNQERQYLGLPPISHLLPHLQSAADLYVTLFPEWYAPTKPDYPKPLVNGDFVFHTPSGDAVTKELERFLAAGLPPILFTASTANMPANSLFEMAKYAVERLKARAVFVTRFKEQLPANLRDSILWQEYVPFNTMLNKVSVIVHCGGIGTVAEACKAGVPQLVLPFSYDQFDNAFAVNELGVGKSIWLRSVTKQKLYEKLSQLQASRNIRDNCMKVSSGCKAGLTTHQIMDKMLAAI